MSEIGFHVARMWHEILMNSSSQEDIEKYPELMERSPIEIKLILMAGASPNLLLRDYISRLRIPKSTLTSIINRLEKQRFLKRTITPIDRRSYGLELDEKGIGFLNKYTAYQNDMGTRIINGLSEVEKKQLVSLLNKISTYMTQGEKK